MDQDPGIDFISHATPSASGESYITADFNMNYDPCMRSVPNYFLFTFTGITKMSVTLSGRLIGTNVPLDPGGSGNSPLQNDRDFLSSVYNDGFNVNGGALTYKNIDALASKFQVLDSPESSQNPITKMFFESAKNGITGLGKAGDDLTNGFVDGKATLLYNKYLGGKEIVKLKNPGFLQKLLTIPTREKLGISLGLISPAASLLTSVLFPSESKEKEPIPSISFIEAEMALSGTIINKSTINNTNYDIEFAIPGSKYTADPIYTPDRYYPLYNEPLGLFALLETPKGVVEYKKVPLNRELVVGCNTNGCPPLIYSEEKLVFKLDRNSIKYVYNKSAEIDEKNTRIYASFEIKERNNCFLNQSVTAQLQNYGIFPPLSYPDVIKNNIFIIQDKGSFATLNDNCSEMVKHFTSIMPLECLFNTGHVLVGQNPAGYFWDIPSYNQIFSYGSDGVGPQDEYIPVQGGSSTNMFANNKEAYLKLHIEYTFKKNKYGKINKFFEILTYPVSLTDGTINLSNTLISSEYLKEKTLPADGYSQGINNYVWDKYNYDAIMTSTSLTTLNAGTEHELTTGAELSGEFELAISDSYLCGAMINPVLDTDVKSFCANKYFGKQYVNNLRLENMVEEQRSAENRPPSEFSFNLYPNPSIGYTYLSVVSPFDGNGKLLINDLSGKTINKFTSEINFASGINESSLDVSDLQAGVYICQLEVGTKKYTQKLVVVK